MDVEIQLRAAESKRHELERQHAEAVAALRTCAAADVDHRQSRVRELDKKIALETVRCEELQLELAASRSRTSPAALTASASPLHNHVSSSNVSSIAVANAAAAANSTNIQVAPSPWTQKPTEIERIMAKIEQDNRILAELDHSRSTTLGETRRARARA